MATNYNPINEAEMRTLSSSLKSSLDNMSRALRCPICNYSTTEPVQLSCIHVFCHGCIQDWLRVSPKCPICKKDANRRSIGECDDYVEETIRAVKKMLRVFGLAPVVYDPTVTAMTQQVDRMNDPSLSIDEIEEHLNVSRIQHYFMPDQQQRDPRIKHETGMNWKERQVAVVEANYKALLDAQRQIEASQESFYSARQDSNLNEAVKYDADEDEHGYKATGDEDKRPLEAAYATDPKMLPTTTPCFRNTNFGQTDAAGMNLVTNYKDDSTERDEIPACLTSTDTAAIFRKRRSSAADTRRLEATMNDSPTQHGSYKTTGEVQHQQQLGEDSVELEAEDSDRTSDAPSRYNLEEDNDKHDKEADDIADAVDMDSSLDDDSTTSGDESSMQRVAAVAAANFPPPMGQLTDEDTDDDDGGGGNGLDLISHAVAASTRDALIADPIFDENQAGIELAGKDATTVSTNVATSSNVSATNDETCELFVDSACEEQVQTTTDVNVDALVSNECVSALPALASDEGTANDKVVANQAQRPTFAATGEPFAMSSANDDSYAPIVQTEVTEQSPAVFSVGQVVMVKARTWPGINKHGGVGRVTKAHIENHVLSYDVAYVLGGRETRVDAVFVSLVDANNDAASRVVSETGGHNPRGKSLRRASRRIAKTIESHLPPALLKKLANDGFDVGKENETAIALPPARGLKRKAITNTNADSKRSASVDSESGINRGILSMLSTSDVCRQADEWYMQRFETALAKKTIHVVTSSLSAHDAAQLKSLCSKSIKWNARVKASDTFDSNKTTLLILPAEQKVSNSSGDLTAKTRRRKAMQAALAGIEIVTQSWISECLTRTRIVVPAAATIIRSLPSGDINNKSCVFGVAKQAAAKMQGIGAHLLSGVAFLLCGSFDKQTHDMSILIKAAGASILPNAGAAKKLLSLKQNLVCLCNATTKISRPLEEAVRAHSEQVLVVEYNWLFDCISSGTILGLNGYTPKDSKAAELWQFLRQKQK
ncbi:hypothetical protein MPSEU_000742300 [Mayamaea pseudoterrestris]|nr:hypothetical protein MPSEU_000742300 [Mayamaea pseudoterrestris]